MASESSLPCSQEPATCPYSEANQSSPSPPYNFLKLHFKITFSSTPLSSKWSLSLGSSHQTPVWTSPLPHTCHVTRPFRNIFDHPNNPRWGIAIVNASDPNVFLTTLILVAVWTKLLRACSRFMCCRLTIRFPITLYQNLTCLVCFLARELRVFGLGLISTVCISSYRNLVIPPNVISATLHFRPSSSCLQISQGRWVPRCFRLQWTHVMRGCFGYDCHSFRFCMQCWEISCDFGIV